MVVCYTGDLAQTSTRCLAPIRALADPVVDLLQEQPYTQVQSYLDDGEPKGNHYYWKTEYAAELSDESARPDRDLFAECPIPGVAAWDSSTSVEPSTSTTRTTGPSGTGMPAMPDRRDRHVGAGRTRRGHRSRHGSATHGSGSDPSQPAATTSTSRPPTRTRSASGRRTAPTSTALSRSRRSTTRTTCSAQTGTSRLVSVPGMRERTRPSSMQAQSWSTGSTSAFGRDFKADVSIHPWQAKFNHICPSFLDHLVEMGTIRTSRSHGRSPT